ncbi:ABC transporter ATP-binding protein [Paenibacillus kobensis]|uniref:ABC transporter ATP-binding protein n=1 Tax=Paenibacillus kobensis TaxID=59841 RepID=UPI000FDB11A9|nr:ABC transporter ATP-binding protein [Paenibacillus kobensis]
MADSIVQTEALTKSISGKAVVNEVNIKIERGDIYGFLGPNGAGKTTTIRLLLGLTKPTSGTVRLFDRDIRNHRLDVLRKVGSLVEYPSYYGHLTAVENLEAVRRLLDVPKERIDDVLAIVRLTKDAGRQVKGYSLGMKQRLGIATALLGNPELLILDEPTNGLDPAGIQEIRELIISLPRTKGVTILISSHLLSEVEQMATRVGIIAKGSMVYQNSISHLREQAISRIRFTVNDPASAYPLLRSSGYEAEWDDRSLTIGRADNASTAEAVALLVKHHYDVYRVEEQTASLESLFLEMTGGERSL